MNEYESREEWCEWLAFHSLMLATMPFSTYILLGRHLPKGLIQFLLHAQVRSCDCTHSCIIQIHIAIDRTPLQERRDNNIYVGSEHYGFDGRSNYAIWAVEKGKWREKNILQFIMALKWVVERRALIIITIGWKIVFAFVVFTNQFRFNDNKLLRTIANSN